MSSADVYLLPVQCCAKTHVHFSEFTVLFFICLLMLVVKQNDRQIVLFSAYGEVSVDLTPSDIHVKPQGSQGS